MLGSSLVLQMTPETPYQMRFNWDHRLPARSHKATGVCMATVRVLTLKPNSSALLGTWAERDRRGVMDEVPVPSST